MRDERWPRRRQAGGRGGADPRPTGNERDDRPAARHADGDPRRRQHRLGDRTATIASRTWARRWCARSRCRPTRLPATATTTAIVLANALVQGGIEANERALKSVDLCKGIDLAVDKVVAAPKARCSSRLRAMARLPPSPISPPPTRSSARWWRRPMSGSDADGIITMDFSVTTGDDAGCGRGGHRPSAATSPITWSPTRRKWRRCRGAAADPDERDLKIREPSMLSMTVRGIAGKAGRPLLIMAEEVSPEVGRSHCSATRTGKVPDRASARNMAIGARRCSRIWRS